MDFQVDQQKNVQSEAREVRWMLQLGLKASTCTCFSWRRYFLNTGHSASTLSIPVNYVLSRHRQSWIVSVLKIYVCYSFMYAIQTSVKQGQKESQQQQTKWCSTLIPILHSHCTWAFSLSIAYGIVGLGDNCEQDKHSPCSFLESFYFRDTRSKTIKSQIDNDFFTYYYDTCYKGRREHCKGMAELPKQPWPESKRKLLQGIIVWTEHKAWLGIG